MVQSFQKSHSLSKHYPFTLMHLLHLCRIASKTFRIIPAGTALHSLTIAALSCTKLTGLWLRGISQILFLGILTEKNPELLDQKIVEANSHHHACFQLYQEIALAGIVERGIAGMDWCTILVPPHIKSIDSQILEVLLHNSVSQCSQVFTRVQIALHKARSQYMAIASKSNSYH